MRDRSLGRGDPSSPQGPQAPSRLPPCLGKKQPPPDSATSLWQKQQHREQEGTPKQRKQRGAISSPRCPTCQSQKARAKGLRPPSQNELRETQRLPILYRFDAFRGFQVPTVLFQRERVARISQFGRESAYLLKSTFFFSLQGSRVEISILYCTSTGPWHCGSLALRLSSQYRTVPYQYRTVRYRNCNLVSAFGAPALNLPLTE